MAVSARSRTQIAPSSNRRMGLKRIASLRMMHQATGGFLKATRVVELHGPERAVTVVLDFWKSVAAVLPSQWNDPRRHMLTKGVGVYALMHIAADIYKEERDAGQRRVDFNQGVDARILCKER